MWKKVYWNERLLTMFTVSSRSTFHLKCEMEDEKINGAGGCMKYIKAGKKKRGGHFFQE